MTAVSLGTVVGPMLVGFLQEALGELRAPLMIASAAGLVLLPVGALISLGPPAPPEPQARPAEDPGP